MKISTKIRYEYKNYELYFSMYDIFTYVRGVAPNRQLTEKNNDILLKVTDSILVGRKHDYTWVVPIDYVNIFIERITGVPESSNPEEISEPIKFAKAYFTYVKEITNYEYDRKKRIAFLEAENRSLRAKIANYHEHIIPLDVEYVDLQIRLERFDAAMKKFMGSWANI